MERYAACRGGLLAAAAYRGDMLAPIDEATAQFLDAAATDLERHLPTNGRVEGVSVIRLGEGVGLVARIRIGAQVVDVEGSGDSLVTAYAALWHHLPEARLTAAFRAMVSGA